MNKLIKDWVLRVIVLGAITMVSAVLFQYQDNDLTEVLQWSGGIMIVGGFAVIGLAKLFKW